MGAKLCHIGRIPEESLIDILQFAFQFLDEWALLQLVSWKFKRAAMNHRTLSLIMFSKKTAKKAASLGFDIRKVAWCSHMHPACDPALLCSLRLTYLDLYCISCCSCVETFLSSGHTTLTKLRVRNSMSPQGIKDLARFRSLTSLDLSYVLENIDEVHLEFLAYYLLELESLSILDFQNLTTLESVAKFTNLRRLDLQGCSTITPEGFAHIGSMTKLHTLLLDGCPITDSSLVHLSKLSCLRVLTIVDTQVTFEGVRELQKKLPKLDVQLEHTFKRKVSKAQPHRRWFFF